MTPQTPTLATSRDKNSASAVRLPATREPNLSSQVIWFNKGAQREAECPSKYQVLLFRTTLHKRTNRNYRDLEKKRSRHRTVDAAISPRTMTHTTVNCQVGHSTSPPLSARLSPTRPTGGSTSTCLSPKNEADRDSSNGSSERHGHTDGSRSASRRSERAGRCPSSLRCASEAPSIASGRTVPSVERNSSTSHVILMRQSPFVQMQCARGRMCISRASFQAHQKHFPSRVKRPSIQHEHARF